MYYHLGMLLSPISGSEVVTTAVSSAEGIGAMIEDFTKLGLGDNATKRPTYWYQKIRSSTKLPQDVNANLVIDGTSHEYLGHPTASVRDNASLFVNKGQIYVVIQRSTPETLQVQGPGGVMESVVAAYRGTVVAAYDVRPGDHLIDYYGKEFRVLSAAPDFNRTFISMHLLLISGNEF